MLRCHQDIHARSHVCFDEDTHIRTHSRTHIHAYLERRSNLLTLAGTPLRLNLPTLVGMRDASGPLWWVLTGAFCAGGRPAPKEWIRGADLARRATAASRVSEMSRLSGILMLASISASMLASITPPSRGNVRGVTGTCRHLADKRDNLR